MASELEKCPHCGSEAHTPTAWFSNAHPIPQCKNPECRAEARSVEAWNRREPPPAPAGSGEAYERFAASVREGRYYRVKDAGPIDIETDEATRNQVGDVLAALHDGPISSLMLFKAGWDARVLLPAPAEPGEPIVIRYRNHRGEVADRRILPIGLRWAATEWHPEPQWLIDAHDLDRQAMRSFAVRDILGPATSANARLLAAAEGVQTLALIAMLDTPEGIPGRRLAEARVIEFQAAIAEAERARE